MLEWILPVNQLLVLLHGAFRGDRRLRDVDELPQAGHRIDPEKGVAHRHRPDRFGGSALGWVIVAGCQPPRIAKEVDYEVKVVTFPDGKQIQMFNVDGENKNANQMFACQVPENYVVRRTIYERVYCGLSYSKDTASLKDTFAIVDPKKKEE